MGLEELLERYVATDDEQAMAELVRQTRGKLMAVARRICGADAEDAVQTAYLSLAKRGGLGGAPVLPWLLTVVARIGYRAKAMRAREHTIAERLAPSAAPPEPPEIAIGGEEAELLRRELWKLPPEYRDALQLRYMHGLSGAEVARLLGVNDSTLRTRLHRGRLMLRSRLGRVLFVLPWLFSDASAALVLGGTMKAKIALVALLLAALGVFLAVSRERAPPARSEAAALTARGGPAPSAPSDGSPAAASTTAEPESAGPILAAGTVVDEAGTPVADVRLIPRGVEPDEAWRSMTASFRGRAADRLQAPEDRIWPERMDDAFMARAPVDTTDDLGRFFVRRPLEPRQTLVFLKDGHAAHEVNALAPDMRIVLPSVRPLRGRVTDSSGSPIPGAAVQILDQPLQDVDTDDDGYYSFPCPPVEVRNMAAWADGYGNEHRRSAGDFRLSRSWLIVDVWDAVTGRPIPDACARLALDDGRPFPGSAAVPRDRVRLPPGRCLVQVPRNLKEGMTGGALHVFAPGYQPEIEVVTLREEPPHLRLALKQGDGPPALAGRVTGAPVARIVVRNAQLWRVEDYEYVTAADTAPGGSFLFSGLPRADYLLVVTAPGMGTVTRRFPVPTDDIEIHVSPGAVLEVLARDRGGAPVAGTAIHVELPDGNRYWIADTDERGWAVFRDLPNEELCVVAVGEGWNRRIHGKDVPALRTTPASGVRTQLTVTVPDLLPAVVRVRDEAGAPQAGVTLAFEYPFKGIVSVVGKTEYDRLQALRVTTGPDGTAQADLYPGEYDIMLRDGTTPVRVAVLNVGDDATNRAEFVVPRRGTVVRGRLRVYGTDEPIRNGVLLVHDEGDTKVAATVRTDAEGRFEIRGLAKGPHMLLLLTGREEYLPHHGEVDLTERDEADIDLFAVPKSVPQPCEVAVTVRSRTAGPLAGARVSVRARVGDGWAVLNRGVTDAEGRVVLPAIEAQSYRVWASADGHETADATVERKGQRADLDVELATKP